MGTTPSPHSQQNSSPSPHPHQTAARVGSPTYTQQQGDNYNQRVPTPGVGDYQMPPTLGLGLPGGGGGLGVGYQGLPYEKMFLQPPTMSSTPQDGHTVASKCWFQTGLPIQIDL